MTPALPSRSRGFSPRFWSALALSIVFLGLGLRTLLMPVSASAYYGLPLGAAETGLAFVQAYGARNVGLSLVAAALLAMNLRRGFAAVLLGATLIAGLDVLIVSSWAGLAEAAKHFAYVAVLAGAGAWMWWGRTGDAPSRF